MSDAVEERRGPPRRLTDVPTPQPFRAGDVVEVLLGACKGEEWVIACYEANVDIAWNAGWPCTMTTKATQVFRLVEAADDVEHARMVEAVKAMRGDHGESDPRREAIERVLERGSTP